MPCSIMVRRSKPKPPPPVSTPTAILPYYGVAPAQAITSDMVKSLQFRGSTPSRLETFILTLVKGQYGYFAYPVSYGLATFVDRDNGQKGAWDGAVGNRVLGPLTIDVDIDGFQIPFYVYRTDQTFDSTTRWRVS